MKRAIGIFLVAGTALASCSGAAQADANEAEAQDTADAASEVEDGLITCAMPDYDGKQGLTTTQAFVLIDGRPKRYSEFQNVAFDLCEPGQQGCSLKMDDGAIAMTYTTPSGVGSRYRVDLSSMEIAAWETQPGEAERSVSFVQGAKCTREPLPQGMTVN